MSPGTVGREEWDGADHIISQSAETVGGIELLERGLCFSGYREAVRMEMLNV